MNLVMFDIDGTLTRTEKIDEVCFVQALHDMFGFSDVNPDWSAYPHCSDSAIIDAIFRSRRGRSPKQDESDAFQAHFLELLCRASKAAPFQAIPGAGAMLHRLAHDERGPRRGVSLASGGWRRTARFKLAEAGLDTAANLPAAFSDDAHAREEIMQISLRRAEEAFGARFAQVVYVGDGLWDARASRNLGYPFIGIASDPAKAQQLTAEGALRIFGNYCEVDAFLDALGEAFGE
jgi:beta-phosphoglucomutase-like phosphatase (HAD superfamily)